MKIDLTKNFIDHKGSLILDGDKPWTLKNVIGQSLLSTFQGDEKLEGQKKYQLYQLGLKLEKESSVELTAEEIALIKDRISKGFTVLVMGQAWDMLEGKL